eukprot:scaffold354176_cov26-Attheya_sp.AAC.1
MILDFSIEGVLRLDMCDYVKNMIKDFPEKLGVSQSPWTEKLMKVDETSKLLPDKRREIFHTFVMKGMFLCKRARQDIQQGIVFLSGRTSKPNEGDWSKLIRLMNFLNQTQNDVATLEADDSQTIN